MPATSNRRNLGLPPADRPRRGSQRRAEAACQRFEKGAGEDPGEGVRLRGEARRRRPRRQASGCVEERVGGIAQAIRIDRARPGSDGLPSRAARRGATAANFAKDRPVYRRLPRLASRGAAARRGARSYRRRIRGRQPLSIVPASKSSGRSASEDGMSLLVADDVRTLGPKRLFARPPYRERS